MSPDRPAAPAATATPFRPAPLSSPRRADDERAGFAAGWAAGARAAAEAAAQAERRREEAAQRAEAERAARLAAAVDLLGRAAEALGARVAEDEARVRAVLQDAAVELAEAVLRRELAAGPGTARDVLARALALPAAPGRRVVAVSPRDHADLVALLAAGDVALPDGVELAADPALAAGDVRVTDPVGTVDAQVAAALDRARRALAEEIS